MLEDFFYNYGLFFLKTFTIVFAILIILSATRKKDDKGFFQVKHLNQVWNKKTRSLAKQIKHKKLKVKKEKHRSKCFSIDFKGDLTASNVECLRQEVSAILRLAKSGDRVLLNLESPGGRIFDYGLAHAQLQRLRTANITLDVVIDRIAASGGYLMACVANKIIAAPYSFIGSIGVVAELFNFYELLNKNNVQVETITSNKYKRTLTPFSKVTAEGRSKVREILKVNQTQFENSIIKYRPKIKLNEVATGEYWTAENAIKLGLVDELGTSDDFIFNIMRKYDVYTVKYIIPTKLSKKFYDKVAAYVGF